MTPRHGRILHLSLAGFWFVQMIVCLFVIDPGWQLYLLEISLWANAATHVAGYSAERPTEVI